MNSDDGRFVHTMDHTNIQPIDSPAAWVGPEVADSPEATVVLEQENIDELLQAVADAQASGAPLGEITRDDYPLPRTEPLIAKVLDQLTDGLGFSLVRGLPVFELSEPECELAYWILGSHIGIPLPQNARNDLLVHVRDQGKDYRDPEVRGYQTTATLDYHVDGSDVVALLCRRAAKSGGASRIASSSAIHNEMLRRDPQLVAELYESFAFDKRLPIDAEGPGFQLSPIFSAHQGRLSARYGRSYIESSQRHEDAPRLTERSIAALDMFDEVASSPSIYLDMIFQPGDMQFLNNHLIVHSRTEYEDHEAYDMKRDLIRFWVTLRDYYEFAPEYAVSNVTYRA